MEKRTGIIPQGTTIEKTVTSGRGEIKGMMGSVKDFGAETREYVERAGCGKKNEEGRRYGT